MSVVPRALLPLAVLATLPGASLAQDALPFLGATAEFVIPLDVSTFVVNESLSDLRQRPDACGSDRFRLEGATRFVFEESSATSTECGEIGLVYEVPEGARTLRVEFRANRSMERVASTLLDPTSTGLRRDALQELRVAAPGGPTFHMTRLFLWDEPNSDFVPFSIVVDPPPGSATVALSWYFEDLGVTNANQAIPSAASADTLVAAVDSPLIRVTRSAPFGDVLRVTDVQTEDGILRTTEYGVATPVVPDAQGPPALRLRVSASAELTHLVAPDGARIELTALDRTHTPDEIVLVLPTSLTAVHGNGTYAVAVLTRLPLPPPPPEPGPTSILPLALAILAAPLLPGAAAAHASMDYARRASGRFSTTSRGLFIGLLVLATLYAGLLAYVLLRGLDVVAFLPLATDAAVLLALFLLLAIAFALAWYLAGRVAVRAMEADAAERQRAERRVRSLLDGAPDAMVVLDERGRIVLANAQAERAFRRPRSELVGSDVATLIPERHRATEEARAVLAPAACATPPRAGLELVAQRADGTEFPIEVSLSPVDDEGRVLVTAAIRDITARKVAQRELERSNRELEQFAYIASHDLQEPLRTIAGFAQLLEQRYGEHLDERGKSYVRRTVGGTRRMQGLINDLLAYSRVQTQGKTPTDVPLDEVLAGVLADLEGLVHRTGADVASEPLPTVRADRLQLAQVLSNLVRNAIQYRDPGRRPVVRVRAKRERAAWCIWVSDNGVGIAPEYHEKVFAIFQRLAPRSADDEGTGLGLAIARKIVERHGGRIWVSSTPGEGSTFHFTLPDAGGAPS